MNNPNDRLTRPELALLFTSIAVMALSFAALIHGV